MSFQSGPDGLPRRPSFLLSKNTAHLLVYTPQLVSTYCSTWSSCHSTQLFCCDQLPSQLRWIHSSFSLPLSSSAGGILFPSSVSLHPSSLSAKQPLSSPPTSTLVSPRGLCLPTTSSQHPPSLQPPSQFSLDLNHTLKCALELTAYSETIALFTAAHTRQESWHP